MILSLFLLWLLFQHTFCYGFCFIDFFLSFNFYLDRLIIFGKGFLFLLLVEIWVFHIVSIGICGFFNKNSNFRTRLLFLLWLGLSFTLLLHLPLLYLHNRIWTWFRLRFGFRIRFWFRFRSILFPTTNLTVLLFKCFFFLFC